MSGKNSIRNKVQKIDKQIYNQVEYSPDSFQYSISENTSVKKNEEGMKNGIYWGENSNIKFTLTPLREETNDSNQKSMINIIENKGIYFISYFRVP